VSFLIRAPPAALKRPTIAPPTTPSSTTIVSSAHVPSAKPEKRPTLGYNALKKSEESLLHETQRMAEIIGAYDVEITQINQQSAMEQAALREVIQQKEEDISRLQGLMEEQRQDMEKLDRDWQERYQKHDQNMKQELQNTKNTLSSRCEELQTLLATTIQRSQAQERKLEALGVNSVTLERLEEDEDRKEVEQKAFEEQMTKLSCSLSSANDFMKTAILDLTSLRDELSLPLSLSA
jgi:septal ring factor EnvC (AmiA/AmiB activator)